jgi:serine/threonine-protein kinase
MGQETDDAQAFKKTIARLELPTDPSAFDATVVPDEPHAWSSLRSPGSLPSITSKTPEMEGDAELSLVDILGEGGMGRVYLATQRSLSRKVAVKTVKDPGSARAVEALCDEAVITGRLSHPNIVPVHALGRDGEGRPLLVMKRVAGVSWDALLDNPDHAFWQRNEIAEDDRLLHHVDVLRKVAHAVELAHSEGIVHRDIKPENVMLGDFGEVYLVDWGIATRVGTATGDKLAGTLHYLAPEMIGGTVDARTDVYLMGATLFELITGSPPHSGDTLAEVLYSAFVAAPHEYGDDVPPELADLATRAMARDPDDRPKTARAFGDALDDYVRHRGSRALSRTGDARLESLRKRVDGAATGGRDLAELRQLVSECRFAFQEARREWAENPAVAPGLDACLALAVRIELDRRDGEAACAMLRELDEPPPALVEAVQALEAELARESVERSRLAQLAKDLDPTVALGVRVIGGGGLAVAAVAIALYRTTMDEVSTKQVFVVSLWMLAVLTLLLLLLWKRMVRTMFNRRLAAWLAIGQVGIVFHRFLALFDPGATPEMVLVTDLAILAVFWALGSIFLIRWMLFVGIGTALCVIPALAYPEHIVTTFTVANLVSVIVFIFGWRRGRVGE